MIVGEGPPRPQAGAPVRLLVLGTIDMYSRLWPYRVLGHFGRDKHARARGR